MTKFLFYTDLHLAGESPRHRVDDFPRAILAKLRETYSVAEAEGCQFLAFGGDFFNSQRIFSYDILSEAMDIVGGSPLATYMVVGEHDLYGHSLDTYRSSTLAFMAKRCPNIQVLWEPLDLGELVLYGKHEPDKMADAMLTKVDPSRMNVLVCHELLTPEKMPFDVVETYSLKGCPFDVVVSGDLHCGFDTHRVEDTWFCNPGSLARRTTADADRWPQVAVVDVEKGVEPKVEMRRLACALPGEDVFGESLAEAARENAAEPAGGGFAEKMEEFEAESTDIHELVQKVGRSEGLREEVLEYLARKRSDKAAEKV